MLSLFPKMVVINTAVVGTIPTPSPGILGRLQLPTELGECRCNRRIGAHMVSRLAGGEGLTKCTIVDSALGQVDQFDLASVVHHYETFSTLNDNPSCLWFHSGPMFLSAYT